MLATKLPLRLAAAASRAYTRVQSLSAARPLPRALESSHNAIAVSRRSYATPGRPKKAVGEASKTVKRTPKTTTTATKTKPKAATPKKAVAKKPKKAKKPIKPKKIAKPKPVKTEEQKVAAKVKAEKLLIKELKKLALDPPPRFRNVSAYNIFFREQMQLKGSDRPFGGELTKQIAADYMSLTPTEVEQYQHLANQESINLKQQYQAWVKSHTPQQIHEANRARLRLRNKKLAKYRPIEDDRQVKGPLSSWIIYYKERMDSGDFKGKGSAPETCKLVLAEFKALPESEKQVYTQRALDEKKRYVREMSELSTTSS